MVQVRFFCREPDGSVHTTVKGHAGFARKGTDLVCAGVSTLVYTLAEAMERMYFQRMLRRCPRIVMEDGSAEIIAVPKPEYLQEVLLVFWVMEAGLYTLGMHFPGTVAVEEALQVKNQ